MSVSLPFPTVRAKILRGLENRFDRNTLVETHNRFTPEFLSARDGSRLRGYFQSWKYVEPVSEKLHSELTRPRNPSPWFDRMRSEMSAGGPWIGVHVRLGNYQFLPAMGVADNAYYRRAISLLREMGHDHRVVVFTDSPDVVSGRRLFDGETNFSILDDSQSGGALETLLIMSQASHLIIANSTFSWWAAWLCRKDMRKKIIFPLPWLDQKEFDDRDLPLPHWIGLSRESLESYRDAHV